jgi:hypothetical protein
MTANDTLLLATLEVAIPLRIAEIRKRGGPSTLDWAWARQEFLPRLAHSGEALLHRSSGEQYRRARTDSAGLVNDLARALAILSFEPGGVRFGGRRWVGTWPETR